MVDISNIAEIIHDSEIQKSELPFFIDVPKEPYISANVRKMPRVVSNFINNILNIR